MTPELTRIFESKEQHRKKMAALPILEKLKILDELRVHGVKMRELRQARLIAPSDSRSQGSQRR